MNLEDIQNPSDIFNLSEEDFSKLDINKLSELRSEEEEQDDQEQESEEEEEEQDNPDDDQEEDDQQESEEDDQEEDPENQGEDDPEESEEDDEQNNDSDPAKLKPEPVKVKAPAKADKAKPSVQKDNADNSGENLAKFHETLTAPLKAAGQEFTFTDPEQIRELASKGIDYTRKMQQISHLRGIGEILRENNLLDPEKLAYAIDLANHKPEAIAKLIQDSGIDTYELDEEKANTYQAVPVDITANSQKLDVKEIVESYANDEKFNSVFQEARSWDNESQVTLVKNPQLLHLLAAHANNGTYDKVMAEVQRERILTGSQEPILAHYNRIGQAMFANTVDDGGQAQAAQQKQQAPAKQERVVIKRKTVDDVTRRKALAATPSAKKARGNTKIKSVEDIYSLSAEEFKNLDPEVLRKFKD